MPSFADHTRTIVAGVAVAALVFGGCSAFEEEDAATSTTTNATSTSVAPDQTADGPGLGRVPELIRQVEPAVVAVVVDRGRQAGEGSGVIVREDGIVVTNAHVVAQATDVDVALADGSQVPARVVATDLFSDLAILEIDEDGLPVAELADGYPEIGELAVAVGNPLGFENSVTAGIISGLGRAIPASATRGSQALVDLVQTDAAISPGNSGGALVGADGQLVGINVAYIPPATGAVSLGFAIPAPTVSDVVEELLEDGTAEHAYLGVEPVSVTDEIAEQFELEVDGGAAVAGVESGTPAAEAGLQSGDVIVAVDGEDIADVGELLTRLRGYDPGDEATLSVIRAGEGQADVDVVLGERPTS